MLEQSEQLLKLQHHHHSMRPGMLFVHVRSRSCVILYPAHLKKKKKRTFNMVPRCQKPSNWGWEGLRLIKPDFFQHHCWQKSKLDRRPTGLVAGTHDQHFSYKEPPGASQSNWTILVFRHLWETVPGWSAIRGGWKAAGLEAFERSGQEEAVA